MKSRFTVEEKRKFLLKKHIKDHLFEYVLDLIVTIIFTLLLLFFCEAQNYVIGVILAVVYSIGKSVSEIIRYKKDYLNIDIKE